MPTIEVRAGDKERINQMRRPLPAGSDRLKESYATALNRALNELEELKALRNGLTVAPGGNPNVQ